MSRGQRRAQPQRKGDAPVILPGCDPYEQWRDKPRNVRMKQLCRILEHRGSCGDQDSAKAALSHLRWEQEFKNGRAPTRRGDEGNGVTITIVDDITGKRAVRVEAGKQREALPPQQGESDTEEGQET